MGIDRMEELMEVGRRITVGGTECRGGVEGRRGRIAKGQEDMKGEYGKHAGQGK